MKFFRRIKINPDLKIGLLFVGIVCGLLYAGPLAAANCALRDYVVERLKSKFHEQLAVGGRQKV